MNQIQSMEFEGIRRVWDDETKEWWYAVVDIVEVLAQTNRPKQYWSDLKRRTEQQSGVQLYANCVQFPMKHKTNGRTYKTECADQQGVLRIIQSIPSPNAEPFKQWLAATGSRRLNEIQNDPLELEREKYRALGYDEEWINARIGSITARNELTDEWKNRGIEGREYGILTNDIHQGTFDGLTVQSHKQKKGVTKGNLRDHMNPVELAFTILGETTAIEETREMDAQGFDENQIAARRAGEITGNLRESYEEQTGRKVISDQSYIAERKQLRARDQEEDN